MCYRLLQAYPVYATMIFIVSLCTSMRVSVNILPILCLVLGGILWSCNLVTLARFSWFSIGIDYGTITSIDYHDPITVQDPVTLQDVDQS